MDLLFFCFGCGGGRAGGEKVSKRQENPLGDVTPLPGETEAQYMQRMDEYIQWEIRQGYLNEKAREAVGSRPERRPLESDEDFKKRYNKWADEWNEWLEAFARQWLKSAQAVWDAGHDPSKKPSHWEGISLATLASLETLRGIWDNPSKDKNYRPGDFVPDRGSLFDKPLSSISNKPGVYTGGGTGGDTITGKTVLITGSRGYTNYDKMLSYLKGLGPIKEIIHGGAGGADSLAERAARELGIPTKIYVPDWSGVGKGAGHVRNSQMLWDNIKSLDTVGGFFSGSVTPGTAGMIEKSIKAGLSGSVTGITQEQWEKLVDSWK